jgi:PAS domain S-box-containing protein
MITITTLDGMLLYVSPACKVLLGFEPHELTGKSVLALLHPDEQDSVARLYDTMMIRPGNYTAVNRARHRDEHYIWLETASRTVTNVHGQVEHVISVARDITMRKRAEDAMRDSEAKYRMVIEQAADAIFISNREGHLLDVNPRGCRLLGYTRAELLHMRMPDIIYVDNTAAAAEQPGKTSLLSERRLRRKDGSPVSVEMNTRRLEDGRTLAIVRDITERKQAEAQRLELAIERERVEVLRRFISDASHDLRTPLSVMRTSVYLLKRTLPEVQFEKGVSHVQLLDEQITRIESLLKDLLTMSNLDRADADTFEFRMCDLNALVKQVLDDEAENLEKKKHSLSVSAAQNLPKIEADTGKLRRALEAIVSNAINYTADGGQIEVSTSLNGSEVIIEVKDNGIGISAVDLPHIFERFYRVDRARRVEKGGMGLGLAIARRVVQTHSGKITVESEPGVGSTFRIHLPTKILTMRN